MTEPLAHDSKLEYEMHFSPIDLLYFETANNEVAFQVL